MVKWSLWSCILILTTLVASSPELQTGIGMNLDSRPKRRPSEAEDDHQMVTIDLSALRPSLPGLVLYKYGEHAPKLVQIDLSALNPQLQPHVIWPQFDQMELFNDRSLDFDSLDAIPYLTDEESLIAPKPRMAKMAMGMTDDNSWSDMDDITDGDIYDFIPDSSRNNELMSLQGSLPLADEVIVPLDWEEEKTSRNWEKRNIYASRGWKAGGQSDAEKMKEKNLVNPESEKTSKENFNVHYTPFGATNWIPGKRKDGRETESEEETSKSTLVGQLGKKNVFVSSGWGPGGQQVSMAGARRHGGRRRVDSKSQAQPMRISSQESWSLPRQYWNVPHLIGGHWQ